MSSMDRAAVGALIRQARETRGLSLVDVATTLTLTPGAVSQWEHGRTTPNPVHARALDSLLGAGGAILQALGYGVVPVVSSDALAEIRELVATIERRIEGERDEARRHGEAIAELAAVVRQLRESMTPPAVEAPRPTNAEH